MTFRSYVLAAALSLAAAGTAMADYKVGAIEVDDLWVRATAPGQKNGAGYFEMENDGKQDDRLLSITSDAAERVELHNVTTENGVSRMGRVDGVVITADGRAKLSPGGYHAMFLKLKAPFAEGTEIPATLEFEKAGEVAVKFKVRPATYSAGGHDASHEKGAMKHNMH